jgi:hypothetical protein
MAFKYELEFGGQTVELESDDELTPEEIEEAAESAFQGVNETPAAPAEKKAIGAVDMVAPGLNRELSSSDKTFRRSAEKELERQPWNPALQNMAGADSRVTEGAMNALNVGGRAIGAAIPTDFTRGTNEDGSSRSFSEAMADPETGVTRGAREFTGEGFRSNWQTMRESKGFLAKAGHAFKAGMHGLGFLASTLLEPTGAGALRKGVKGAQAVATGGSSVAKDVAQTYIKETGVPTAALERMAEPGGKAAIKKASLDVDEDIRAVVAERIEAMRAPQLAELSNEERKVFEQYQERLSEILDEKSVKTEAARTAQEMKLRELDEEVRGFLDNVKSNKERVASGIKDEAAEEKAGIQAMAGDLKQEKIEGAPDAIRGDVPALPANQRGNDIQNALLNAKEDVSARYGEYKDEAFGFKEMNRSAIPGKHNPLERAWSRTMRRVQDEFGGRNVMDQRQMDAFTRVVNQASPAGGPATFGELVNARKHIGRAIWGKSGIEEEDALFRGVDRRVKEAFYASVNDEIGSEMLRFYRRKKIPQDMAEKMVEAWDKFNDDYSNLRSGLETLEDGIRFSKAGGKTDSYSAKLFKMGTNDIVKAKTITQASEQTKDVWKSVEGAVINDLVDRASPGGTFSPKAFSKVWGDLSSKQRDKMVALLGEERVKSVDSFHKKLELDLEDIDAAAKGGVDALVKRLAEKGAAIESKTGSAKNAVRRYQELQKSGVAAERRAADVDIRDRELASKQGAKAGREASLDAIATKRRQVEAIGTVALTASGKGRTQLSTALTPTNMTGPRRKAIMSELETRFGADEARRIQDVFFAKSLGAEGGRIPLITRIPTGRALYLGFVTGHPLAVALATSPHVAALAFKHGKMASSAFDGVVSKVVESPKLTNLYQMLDGIKTVEARNRVILRILQEMEKEGIELPEGDDWLEPENEESPSEEGLLQAAK